MFNKTLSLTLVALLFSCGEHRSHHNAPDPQAVAPLTRPVSPAPTPTLDNKQFSAVKATFNGSFIGVVDGQLYNFDSEKQVGEPVKFIFANTADAKQTMLGTLQRRPQRIDVVNDDFVLLQRPNFVSYANGQSVQFEQDCFLINVKTGAIWKFDEFFPTLNSFQTVENGKSKKVLFIGRKKVATSTPNVSSEYMDFKRDYNYPDNGYSMSLPTTSRKVIVSIDFSDSEQVTLRPISSGVEDIGSFLADSQGNALAVTSPAYPAQPRVIAILQNEQTPLEASINNVTINNYYGDNRVVVDSKKNFWRFTRSSGDKGVKVKAERLILARDLDNRPALMPLTTMTQELGGWYFSFRFDGNTFNAPYKGNEIFAFTGLLAIAEPSGTFFKVLTDAKVETGSTQQFKAALDATNGKVLSYLQAYSNGTPTIVEYDFKDLGNTTSSSYVPDTKSVFGGLTNMSSSVGGGIDLETLDGPNVNSYHYDGATGGYSLVKSERLETDNKVRILVPVSTID